MEVEMKAWVSPMQVDKLLSLEKMPTIRWAFLFKLSVLIYLNRRIINGK